VCAKAEAPFWIDDSNVLFAGYTGAMPDSIMVPAGGQGSVAPNQVFVANAATGTPVRELPELVARWPLNSAGPTYLFSNFEEVTCFWIEAVDLLEGVFQPQQIGSSECALRSWSPDGRYVLTYEDGMGLQALDLRTAESTILDTTLDSCINSTWSPDGDKVACRGANSMSSPSPSIHILSLDGSPERVVTVGELLPQEWETLSWLP
jgi:hypothetical protein